MQSLNRRIFVVAGGTANVGSFVTRSLLERKATVVVPSRSEKRISELREHLGGIDSGRLHTFAGELGDEAGAADLGRRITNEVGTPDGVIASLGNFVTTPSILEASKGDFQRILDGYLVSHFMAARAFLPLLEGSGGTYVFLQGQLAFELHPELGTDLISVATAAQHMLFRALTNEPGRARVIELVSHAFIRDRQPQPGSPLSGEVVGAFAAYLLSGGGVNGQTIHLRSPEQLMEVGLDAANP